ncbi:MAG: hypothetical protein DRJ28_01815 [Actinobacteria bacterium]|nr:MAG: hypothetical protein DRJ28_01815 [Actinomycetota bacterium]
MRPHTDVHRVKLNKPDRVHDAPEMPNVQASSRSTGTESLRSERYTARCIDRDRSHRLTFTIRSTLPAMLHTLLAGIRTLVLVPLFFLLTLVFAAVIVIVGAFRPGASIHDKILKVWSGLFLKIPPVRVEVSGIEKTDPTRRYVVVSNHLSMYDIPLLLHELPLHGRYLAKKEVFKIPLVAQAMRTVGIIEVNRQKGGSSRQAINEGVRVAAERGHSLLVYPEGTRSTEGELLPFHKGAFRIAIDTNLPILPVVIEGTERVSKPGSKIFYPGYASMRILDPIETTGMTNKEDLVPLITRVEAEMNEVFNAMRQTTDG